jgi:hypothetical protein
LVGTGHFCPSEGCLLSQRNSQIVRVSITATPGNPAACTTKNGGRSILSPLWLLIDGLSKWVALISSRLV